MSLDPSFDGAGRDVGLELWRIESMKPVKQAEVRKSAPRKRFCLGIPAQAGRARSAPPQPDLTLCLHHPHPPTHPDPR